MGSLILSNYQYLLLNLIEAMLYERMIEIGRVVYIRLGDHAGKICVVLDLVDQKHLLVDGPTSGVPRTVLRLNQVALTDFKIAVPRSCRSKTVRVALEKDDITAKFMKTQLYIKAQAKIDRRGLSDFDRFKTNVAKISKNRSIRSTMKKLKKA